MEIMIDQNRRYSYADCLSRTDKKLRAIITSLVCLVWLVTGTVAQETVTYDIISATGTIVDRTSGKVLKSGDKINLQTGLMFNSLTDRAVLLSPSKTKYFLELPKSSFVNQQMTVTSDQAITPVRIRPALITGVRGKSVLTTKGVSPQSLKEYLAVDTFTIIGSKLTLPVTKADAEKFDLLLRYENGDSVEEYLSTGFSIAKNDLKIQGNRITECYVLLKEGNQIVPITRLSLFFVEKEDLFNEFDSLLKALNLMKKDNMARTILRQYCTDVYGIIDSVTLEATLTDYLR